MPKKAKELSALEVSRLKAPGFVSVGGVAGLALQVTPSGIRSWVLRVKVGDKRRDIGLGAYPGVTLAEARRKAAETRAQVEQGIDPIENRKRALSQLKAEQAKAITFQEAARRLIESKSPGWKNAKHAQQWQNTLATYAYPVIGDLDVRDVAQHHVEAILSPIWQTKTETASRVQGRIENVIDWAIAGGHRSGDNPARWKGLLDKRLGAPSKIAKVEHHAALPIDEVPGFYADLRQRNGVAARALEFTLLTAVRSGETRGATWDEIDLETETWIIPAERMKAAREHRVPLSSAALALLRSLPRLDGCAYVFFAPRGGKLSDAALGAVMKRMQRDEVPHGLRSSFRDWAGERTNFPRDLCEMALAHTIKDKAEAAYRRGDLLEKRRVMMNAWAKFVQTPAAKGARVIALGQRAA